MALIKQHTYDKVIPSEMRYVVCKLLIASAVPKIVNFSCRWMWECL